MWSSTVLIEIIKFFKDWFLNRKAKDASKELQKVVAIYDNMHRLVNSTDVSRFLIHKIHNGGGLIKPTSELFLTALYEDYRAPFKSNKQDFVKVPLSQSTVRILVNAYTNNYHKVITHELNENGYLKNQYEKEGVALSEIHFLYADQNTFYFASIGTESLAKDLTTAKERSEIDIVINNIKTLLKP